MEGFEYEPSEGDPQEGFEYAPPPVAVADVPSDGYIESLMQKVQRQARSLMSKQEELDQGAAHDPEVGRTRTAPRRTRTALRRTRTALRRTRTALRRTLTIL